MTESQALKDHFSSRIFESSNQTMEENDQEELKEAHNIAIISAVIILLIGLIFGYLPALIKQRSQPGGCQQLVTSLSLMAAAGVFLAASMIHLLGDATSELQDAGRHTTKLVCSVLHCKQDGVFPLSFALSCYGFLAVLTCKVVATYLAVQFTAEQGGTGNAVAEVMVTADSFSQESDNGQQDQLLPGGASCTHSMVCDPSVEYGVCTASVARRLWIFKRPRFMCRNATPCDECSSHPLQASWLPSGSLNNGLKSPPSVHYDHLAATNQGQEQIQPHFHIVQSPEGCQSHSHDSSSVRRGYMVTAFVLDIALAVHSVLLGLSLGASKSSSTQLSLLIAVVAHKGLAAFALGSAILRGTKSVAVFWMLLIPFAVSTPAGILVGLYQQSQNSSPYLISIASGACLFVGMEIIWEELVNQSTGEDGAERSSMIWSLCKLGLLFLGFQFMMMLAFFV